MSSDSHRRRELDQPVDRRLARDAIAIVRLALVVVVRQRREVLRDRRPDGVELDRERAIEHRDAVRLLRRELERVSLAQDRAIGFVIPIGPKALSITSGAFCPFSERPRSSICVNACRSRVGPTSKRSIVVSAPASRTIVCAIAVAPNRWFTSYLYRCVVAIEAAHVQQLARRNRVLSPAVQVVLAVQQHVGGAERIRELE